MLLSANGDGFVSARPLRRLKRSLRLIKSVKASDHVTQADCPPLFCFSAINILGQWRRLMRLLQHKPAFIHFGGDLVGKRE